MVSVLAIEPKVRGFKHGLCNGFLRTIQICRAPSFEGAVKPSTPCRKILYVREPCIVRLRYVSEIQGHFFPTLCFAIRCFCCNHRELVDESGTIRTQTDTQNTSENDCSA
jgi:hypothetical protein